MRPFTFSKSSGSGNDTCPYPKDKQVKLNNEHMENYNWKEFLNQIFDFYDYYGPAAAIMNLTQSNCTNLEAKRNNFKVMLSNRQTVRRWGTAYYHKEKILLYRHSVWIFIHELAHIIVRDNEIRTLSHYRAHGNKFGEILEEIALLWDSVKDDLRLNNKKIKPIKSDYLRCVGY
jgi:hypothetical protein